MGSGYPDFDYTWTYSTVGAAIGEIELTINQVQDGQLFWMPVDVDSIQQVLIQYSGMPGEMMPEYTSFDLYQETGYIQASLF